MGTNRLNFVSGEMVSDSPYECLSPPNTDDALNESNEVEGGEEKGIDDENPGNPITWGAENEGDMRRGILTNT